MRGETFIDAITGVRNADVAKPTRAAQPLRFNLLATPQDDGVTASRVETKFAVPHADVAKLRHILAQNCRPIVFAGRVSHVHSIYFDDCLLSSARENLGGADRRTKVRLRWYDSPLPTTQLFLEFKHRLNRTIVKDRFALECGARFGSMTYTEIQREITALLPERFGTLWALRSEPVLVNTYRREHFAVPGTPHRLTLDYDIQCYEQTARVRPELCFGVPLYGMTVIEAKSPLGREPEVRRLLHPLRLRATRSSKYVTGCQALGVLTGVQVED